MKRTSIRDFLEEYDAISEHSTKTIRDSKLVLVSHALLPDEYDDIVNTFEHDPLSTIPLKYHSRSDEKQIFKEIDHYLNQKNYSKVFAYIHKDQFDHVALCYQN